GVGWPLHVVGVARRGLWVEVSLNCPSQYELARLLCDLSKFDERLAWGLVPGFFCELSPSYRHDLLATLHFALRDRPMADVLLDPKRSALMRQKHLQASLAGAPDWRVVVSQISSVVPSYEGRAASGCTGGISIVSVLCEATISDRPSRSRMTQDQIPTRGSAVCSGP